MEQKKKEHIKKMAADRRMAQKFFLIQVQNLEVDIPYFFSGNGDISNSSGWHCHSQKPTAKVDKYPVLVYS